MKLIKLLAVLAVIAVAGYFLVWPLLFGSANVAERKMYWEAVLAGEIPVGSTKEQIKQWTQKRTVHLDELPQQHMLYVVVEKIPDKGLVCSEWNIIAEITMDGDKSVQQKIESAGSCL